MSNEKINFFKEQNFPYVPIYAKYDVSYRSFSKDGVSHLSPEETVLHVSNQIHIYYVQNGSGILQIENKQYTMNPGNFILVQDWQVHQFKYKDTECRYCVLQFDLCTLDALKNIPHIETDLTSWIFNIGKTQEAFFSLDEKHILLFNELLEKYDRHKGFCMDILRFSTFLELIVFCFVHIKKTFKADLGKTKKESISKKAMNYIDLHYLENITLEDIANHLFISRKYLNNVFKKETNFTVKNYIIHRRIIQAKLYLMDQNTSVQEAFSSSGFSEYSNFFKHFKKIVGMTPKQYQKYFLAYQKKYYQPELLEKFNSDLTDE